MWKPMDCPRCGKRPKVMKFSIFGCYLCICETCEWANEGGDRQDAIREWNEAHGGTNADNNK